MDRRNLFLRITEAADLPMEPLPGVPLVEIAGEGRVLIENHHGVTAYANDHIEVKVAYGHVCIMGADLELARMTGQQLIISGKIGLVELRRGG